jgi:hypothetical protein
MEKQYPIWIGQNIGENQITALEYLICKSPDLKKREIAKKVIIWLIRNSENLTKQISIIFTGKEKLSEDILCGIHSINSCNGNTHINSLLTLMKSAMRISSSGNLGESPMASISFDGNATRIFYDNIKDEIAAIQLLSD